jgi:DNA-binding GntR family transcriptional regulator
MTVGEPAPDLAVLTKLQPRVLARQVVLSALRERILAEQIAPGSHISEVAVAAQMGVSRAPVREAIRHLEQEGLVSHQPKRGAVVVGLGEREMQLVRELRALIEARTIGEACGRVTPADLAALEELMAAMRRAVDDHDVERLTSLDREFHGTIVRLAGFDFLTSAWQSVSAVLRARLVRAVSGMGPRRDAYLRENVDYHQPLIDVLRSGDRERAERLAWHHVADVPEALRRELEG